MTRAHLERLLTRATLPYADKYIVLYSAYNQWYMRVTRAATERQALQRLKERYGIWDEYREGTALGDLVCLMAQLADYTQKYPFPSARSYWHGELDDSKDWRSLIEFWYQVRCNIVHGATVHTVYVRFAYATLFVYIDEVLMRIKSSELLGDFHDWGVDMRPPAKNPYKATLLSLENKL